MNPKAVEYFKPYFVPIAPKLLSIADAEKAIDEEDKLAFDTQKAYFNQDAYTEVIENENMDEQQEVLKAVLQSNTKAIEPKLDFNNSTELYICLDTLYKQSVDPFYNKLLQKRESFSLLRDRNYDDFEKECDILEKEWNVAFENYAQIRDSILDRNTKKDDKLAFEREITEYNEVFQMRKDYEVLKMQLEESELENEALGNENKALQLEKDDLRTKNKELERECQHLKILNDIKDERIKGYEYHYMRVQKEIVDLKKQLTDLKIVESCQTAN
jgi:hypothetical protein